MAHQLTCKTANLIDCVIVSQRLAGYIQDRNIGVYRSADIEVKSKDHNRVLSRVNLKLKSIKNNYLPENYDVSKLQDEILNETFQEQSNTNLESLKFDNVEDGWNYLRKSIREVDMVSQERRLRLKLGIIMKKFYGLIVRRRGLCKNYLSDKSYENKRNVKKVEKALKYELRRCEVEEWI